MTTIHPHMPSRAAALGYKRIDLFDVHAGIGGDSCAVNAEKPRDATAREVRAYLLDLAAARGIEVPEDATLSQAGIYVEGHGYILDMPGYGADQSVTMIVEDETGTVRTSRIGVTAKGALGIDKDAVRKACALPKPARKAPAKRKAPDAALVAFVEAIAAAAPEISPVERVEAVAAPVAPETAPDALAERVAALEAMVARLARPVANGKRVRSEAERAAIVRAWRYRAAMRERADLDRRALEAANGAYRGSLDVIGKANADAAAWHERYGAESARADALGRTATRHKEKAEAVQRLCDMYENTLRNQQGRADRMARSARRHRTAAKRAGDDLRGAQAEARALMRRIEAARAAPAPIVPVALRATVTA